jgi:hypothetical protein
VLGSLVELEGEDGGPFLDAGELLLDAVDLVPHLVDELVGPILGTEDVSEVLEVPVRQIEVFLRAGQGRAARQTERQVRRDVTVGQVLLASGALGLEVAGKSTNDEIGAVADQHLARDRLERPRLVFAGQLGDVLALLVELRREITGLGRRTCSDNSVLNAQPEQHLEHGRGEGHDPLGQRVERGIHAIAIGHGDRLATPATSAIAVAGLARFDVVAATGDSRPG